MSEVGSVQEDVLSMDEAMELVEKTKDGKPPKKGARYLMVERSVEMGLIKKDIDRASNATSEGGSIRLVVAEFGGGKSLFLNAARQYALESDCVILRTDLSRERLLTKHQGLETFKALMSSVETKGFQGEESKGTDAIRAILDTWLQRLEETLPKNLSKDDNTEAMEMAIEASVRRISAGVNESAFKHVLTTYYAASQNQGLDMEARRKNREKKYNVVRWLKGDYATKTESKRDLGDASGPIPDIENWKYYLSAFARLAKEAGYSGVVMQLDEARNAFWRLRSDSLHANYEALLEMVNNPFPFTCIQMAGTLDMVQDQRKGFAIYKPLKDRLGLTDFAEGELATTDTAVLRLKTPSAEGIATVLRRIDRAHMMTSPLTERASEEGGGKTGRFAATEMDDVETFFNILRQRTPVGGNLTIRDISRAWMDCLNGWGEHPERNGVPVAFSEIMESVAQAVVLEGSIEPQDRENVDVTALTEEAAKEMAGAFNMSLNSERDHYVENSDILVATDDLDNLKMTIGLSGGFIIGGDDAVTYKAVDRNGDEQTWYLVRIPEKKDQVVQFIEKMRNGRVADADTVARARELGQVGGPKNGKALSGIEEKETVKAGGDFQEISL